MAPTNESYKVQVLDRMMAVFEALSEKSGITLAELSEQLKLNKSTVHRLLMVLESYRLVERATGTGKYRLGLRLFELGSKAVEHLDLRESARPYLERLVFETGEGAHLCILDHGEVLYLEKVESSRTVRIPSSIGRRNPAHCTSVGKVLLAYLPDNQLDNLIKTHGLKAYTQNTIVTPSELRNHLQRVRQLGYALDNEEIEEGLICIGAPVRDFTKKVIASISISGPAFRMTSDKIPTLARTVVATANQFSSELGFQEPTGRTETADQIETGEEVLSLR
jgi:DNA-binding IclR family transcriptional regulator